jgi:hypothetical protein
MTVERIRVSTGWLDLREPADAAARSGELAGRLRRHLPEVGPWVIHDLACGTGAMGRWLAPLLPGPQLWVLRDRDADLLEVAAADLPGPAADGSPVAVETSLVDITRLDADELFGASLVTASSLLDLLTEHELVGLVELVAAVGPPALLTLSVTGRVRLAPRDPFDARVVAAFNAHQRRTTWSGRLLGPDAVARAVDEFRRRGAEVVVRPSPWRLGPGEAKLAAEWFSGWLGAACEQDPAPAAEAGAYERTRLAQASAGELAVTVDHADLLVLPRGST